MTEPIKPSEVGKHKVTNFPPEVIEAFNELIAAKYSFQRAIVFQEDVVEKIIAATGVSRDKIFDEGWLNINEAFEDAGWKVTYTKPDYYSDADPYFTFIAPSRPFIQVT